MIFIHVPKAAGQTIRSIVGRQYPREEILDTTDEAGADESGQLEDVASIKIFLGHLHYGFHQKLQSASTYVTMLREPVSRVLSLYRYVATTPSHHLHEYVLRTGLLNFVSGSVDENEIENGQTRQISGLTTRSPDASSLAQAKENLARAFLAVGVAERFDESLVLMRRRLGWKMPFYIQKNVTQQLPLGSELADALEVIRSRNTLDVELYEFGAELLQEEIHREGWSFDVELSAFRTLNAVARLYRYSRDKARHLTDKDVPDS